MNFLLLVQANFNKYIIVVIWIIILIKELQIVIASNFFATVFSKRKHQYIVWSVYIINWCYFKKLLLITRYRDDTNLSILCFEKVFCLQFHRFQLLVIELFILNIVLLLNIFVILNLFILLLFIFELFFNLLYFEFLISDNIFRLNYR